MKALVIGGTGPSGPYKLTLRTPTLPTQTQEILCGGRYLSGDDAMRTFAAGALTNRFRLEVQWRSGRVTSLEGLEPNFLYEIQEPSVAASATAPAMAEAAKRISLFDSRPLSPTGPHHELPFDDFAGQPLLPKRYSQLGPGIACFDFDQDGHEDLALGSGLGGIVSMLRGDGHGGFSLFDGTNVRLPDDGSGLAAFASSSAQSSLLVAVANYETPSSDRPAVLRWNIQGMSVTQASPVPALEASSSAGPLALGDFDGDGNLDLFVGGRLIAGRFPEPASSAIYRNQGGSFVLDPEGSYSDNSCITATAL